VTVRENGVTYSFDMTRVMFSSGNVTEKARWVRYSKSLEHVALALTPPPCPRPWVALESPRPCPS
jgi:hypothetical protein